MENSLWTVLAISQVTSLRKSRVGCVLSVRFPFSEINLAPVKEGARPRDNWIQPRVRRKRRCTSRPGLIVCSWGSLARTYMHVTHISRCCTYIYIYIYMYESGEGAAHTLITVQNAEAIGTRLALSWRAIRDIRVCEWSFYWVISLMLPLYRIPAAFIISNLNLSRNSSRFSVSWTRRVNVFDFHVENCRFFTRYVFSW